jgi:hypothetical protein
MNISVAVLEYKHAKEQTSTISTARVHFVHIMHSNANYTRHTSKKSRQTLQELGCVNYITIHEMQLGGGAMEGSRISRSLIVAPVLEAKRTKSKTTDLLGTNCSLFFSSQE